MPAPPQSQPAQPPPYSLTGYIQAQPPFQAPPAYPPQGYGFPPLQTTQPQTRQPAAPPPPPPPPPPAYAQQPPPYPAQPAYSQPPAYPQQQPQAYPPQPAYPPPPSYAPLAPAPARRGLPTWLMTIGFALLFGGLVFAIYWMVKASNPPSPSASVESPAAKPGAKLNPYQKYIEISGVRFTTDTKKKPVVKFVVTNHSGADIAGLAGNVTIWGRTQKSEEEAAGTFSFKADVGPFESRDMQAPLTTKLPMVQLPDWQNVSTDIQITAPGS